ncbi:MAG: hypothetical protein NDJ18_01855 [candidate division Zixibacteria bacterium]|nr:hypothetical protein [candidate division Zixibacteria bacterium]
MDISTLIAGLLTIAILTFLYRDNPIYKFAEYLLVGVSIGYALVIAWTSTMMDLLFEPLAGGKFSLIVPLTLGLMIFARMVPRFSPLSRIPLAVLIGSGAGAAIPAMLGPRILTQMSDTVGNVVGTGAGPSFSGIVVLIGLLATLSYFYFSRPHQGALGLSAKIGTYFLMVFFGATFGYTVMSRMSVFIGRAEFLLSDLLGFMK